MIGLITYQLDMIKLLSVQRTKYLGVILFLGGCIHIPMISIIFYSLAVKNGASRLWFM